MPDYSNKISVRQGLRLRLVDTLVIERKWGQWSELDSEWVNEEAGERRHA